MLAEFFNRWHLKISIPKTVSSVFHLANRCANRELNISLDGSRLNFVSTPKYLGVTLDRSLTFHEHAKATAQKTQARVSLLKKLAGTGWGANFTTLRTSTLALAFSTAEYAAPAWSHSTHVHKVDVVLNDAMRLISGTLTATPVSNLPILSGIPPAQLRRDAQYAKLAQKHDRDKCLVPAPSAFEGQRLPRRHFATQAAELRPENPPLHLSHLDNKTLVRPVEFVHYQPEGVHPKALCKTKWQRPPKKSLGQPNPYQNWSWPHTIFPT